MLEDSRQINFPALKITQPIGEFFIGSLSADDLFRIAYFDIRGLRPIDGIEQYLGFQRTLNEKRVEEIRRYVNTTDATFPSAVILAIDERCVEARELHCDDPDMINTSLFVLKLKNIPEPEEGDDPVLFRQIARVLDGQHRIAGLEGLKDRKFDVNIALFIGLDLPTQASVFSIVNLAQTKVNPSLVYDLFSYDKARSPEKTAHELAVALDSAQKSPFYKRIKRLGTATEGRFGETLSQATFVRALLPYLSDDIMTDREIGKKGGRWPIPNNEQARRMIFRLPFVQDHDVDIGEVLWNYFAAIADRWPESWAWTGNGRILNRTTGLQGFMRFLGPAFRSIASPGGKPTKEQFQKIFLKVDIPEDQFTSDVFKPGSSGSSALYNRLLAETNTSP